MTRPTPNEIREIYAGINNLPLFPDMQGWNSDGPIFAAMFDQTKPSVIVEVGSWKGRSACHMAKLARERGLQPIIYCVDAWLPPIGVGLGEIPRTQIPESWLEPTFYQQFLFNVKHARCDDMIVPVRGLTHCVSWLFQAWQVAADLIYIDASHDELSVHADLKSYWPVLKKGGIMFGDDFSSHEGVARAVRRFATEVGRPIHEYPAEAGTQWALSPK